jgi:hypothetical protein
MAYFLSTQGKLAYPDNDALTQAKGVRFHHYSDNDENREQAHLHHVSIKKHISHVRIVEGLLTTFWIPWVKEPRLNQSFVFHKRLANIVDSALNLMSGLPNKIQRVNSHVAR